MSEAAYLMPLPTPDPVRDEAEIALLGSVFAEPEGAGELLDAVAGGDFAHRPHNLIWGAIARLHSRGVTPDPLAVREELRERRELDAAGGSPYLAQIVEIVPTSANGPYWAARIRERAIRRRAIAKLESGDEIGEVRALLDHAISEQDTGLPPAVPALEVVDEAPEFFVPGLIPDREPIAFSGRGGALKTSVMLELAGASAAEALFLDAFEVVSGPSLFVTAEDAPGVLRNRLEALCRGHGWEADQVLSRVHFLAAEGHVLEDPTFQAHLIGEAARVEARSIYLDPLVFLTKARENSNDEMRPVMAYLKRLGREAGAPAIFGHHESKPHEERRNAIDRLRGASAIVNATRAVLHFQLADDGHLTISNVRQSRAALYPPFAVDIEIETVYENAAAWYSARLTRSLIAPVTIEAESAIQAALATLEKPTTNELNREVARRGIDPREILPARKRMEKAGRIAFESGPNRAKIWRLPGGHPPGSESGGHPGECPPGKQVDMVDICPPESER